MKISGTRLPIAEINALCNFARSFYEGHKYGFLDGLKGKQLSEIELNTPGQTNARWLQPMRDTHAWLQRTINIQ